MTSTSPEHWSLSRSLAFLAANFAIVLACLLPTAVTASPATGAPITLCSGEQIVVFQGSVTPRPDMPTPMDSLECGSCLQASFTSLVPQPPLTSPSFAPCIASAQPISPAQASPAPAERADVRPPSTAPPAA